MIIRAVHISAAASVVMSTLVGLMAIACEHNDQQGVKPLGPLSSNIIALPSCTKELEP